MKINKLKYLIIGIVSATFLFSSCNDLLNVPSNSLVSDDVIFSEPDSTNYAIGAIYDIIGQNNSYRNRLWLQMAVNTDIEYRPGWSSGTTLTSIKSDDLFALYNSNSSIGDGYNNSDAANPWSRIYQGIERANLVIAGVREHGNPKAGNDMGHLLGEALTIRAYFYYDLVKWWGDVPARFEPVNQATIYLGKTNRDEIYDQLISDLQEASELLYSPGTKYTNTTKRISKDAARGLLARISLSAAGYSMRPVGTSDAEIKITVSDARKNELYTIARKACKDIIDDGKYTLANDFKQIFYDQCQDIESHGRETIWQLPYNYGLRGRMIYNLGLPRDADGKNNTVTIGGQFKIMPNFYYDYNINDKRRDITVVPYKVVKSTTVTGVMEQTVSAGIVGFNLGKWRAEWMKTPISGTDDGVSPIVLRYADVLLMFAESDLYLNGNQGAEYFNMVRRRAFGQALNTTSVYDLPLTLANIKNERAFEFAGENIRKYDLIRWGELKSGIDAAKSKLNALRDGTGEYANVPQTIYYKYTVDNTISTGERVLTIYGLQRGENEIKTDTDPSGGWVKKAWTQATSSTGEAYLSAGFINSMYLGNPDKRQLLPIFHQIILVSNSKLANDYGYDN